MSILQLCGVIAISLVVITVLCRVLAIPWSTVAKTIPDEVKTKKGYISLIGFVLMLIFIASLASNPQLVDIVLNVMFKNYQAHSGTAPELDINQAIWACVVLFLGNFFVLACFREDERR